MIFCDIIYRLTYMLANITHIPSYSVRCGCTARLIPNALRDGGKTLGGKTNGSSINETVA